MPCTFDFNVGATKYFHGLGDGEVPLCVMFSGTVFYARAGEALQVAPISWDKEARFALPVKVWREMMDSLLSEHRLGSVCAATFSRVCTNTKCETEFLPGSKLSRACCRRKRLVRS